MTEICYDGTLENIREKLEKYTLEDFSFISENPTWTTKEAMEKYKNCAFICGNFKEYSNAFSIITNDKVLIAEFQKLFEENRKRKE